LSVLGPACLVVSEVRTKTVTTVAGKRHPKMASSGRAENGLVKASYRLPFFALFFFVDFLAVFFLAAIKWLLRVRCPIRSFVARFGTPDCEASGWLHYQLRRIALAAIACWTAMIASISELNKLGQCFVKANWQT